MRTAVVIAVVLAGCSTAKPRWVAAEGAYAADGAGFDLQGPPGWMRRNTDAGHETFVATRDGSSLQRIVAGSTDAGKALGFGASKRTFEPEMSAVELAELVVDDLRSMPGTTDVQVLENAPAQVSGRGGFHVLAAFRDDGLRHRVTLYGLREGRRLFWIFYLAPERHYFPLDLPTFEKVLGTYHVRGAPPAAPPSS
jgi:hypothetical protein